MGAWAAKQVKTYLWSAYPPDGPNSEEAAQDQARVQEAVRSRMAFKIHIVFEILGARQQLRLEYPIPRLQARFADCCTSSSRLLLLPLLMARHIHAVPLTATFSTRRNKRRS